MLIIPFDRLWEQYNRIIKDNCPIILFGREPFTSILITSNIDAYKHKWIWNKKQSGSPQNAKYMPLQLDEDIVVFCKDGKKVNYYPIMRKGKMRKRGGYKESSQIMGEFQAGYENYSDLYYPTNIYELANPRKDRLHPCQKPIELLKYLIETYSKEGNIILDNTMGVGSTGIAALQLWRKFIGIELDENYFNIAKSNIEKISSLLA